MDELTCFQYVYSLWYLLAQTPECAPRMFLILNQGRHLWFETLQAWSHLMTRFNNLIYVHASRGHTYWSVWLTGIICSCYRKNTQEWGRPLSMRCCIWRFIYYTYFPLYSTKFTHYWLFYIGGLTLFGSWTVSGGGNVMSTHQECPTRLCNQDKLI